MKALLVSLATLTCSVFLGGCLTTPVSKSGGSDALTVTNSNVNAILNAAQGVFAASGYTVSGSNFPESVSFDKPAGDFGKLMYGSYGTTTTVRATLMMTPIPETNNFRLSTKVTRVSDAGEAGFEDTAPLLGDWSGQFKPLLRKIAAEAQDAGPGY
jgi:hypothetical protein